MNSTDEILEWHASSVGCLHVSFVQFGLYQHEPSLGSCLIVRVAFYRSHLLLGLKLTLLDEVLPWTG